MRRLQRAATDGQLQDQSAQQVIAGVDWHTAFDLCDGTISVIGVAGECRHVECRARSAGFFRCSALVCSYSSTSRGVRHTFSDSK